MQKAKVGKKLSKQKLAFITEILRVLLSGKGSCLHTVSGGGFVHLLVDGPQHFAVERLITHFGAGNGLADLAANAYLNRFKGSAPEPRRDLDALEYAYRIAERFPLKRETAERLVGCMAEAGWYGRLEGCARKYCARDPKPEEVALLFRSYMDGASYGSSTDEALAKYAQDYMPAAQAERQLQLLAKRNERFHEESAY
ncbi:MAG: hypothetical protein G01um1014106_593 [Parcubacteria group bacterium Gr01-1014_106]|nr:MAG: hypothetical protein G01um1014106_593 [Parcubacteria group bacterium Gr01-1014_106]